MMTCDYEAGVELQHVKAPPKPKRRGTLCGISKQSSNRLYVSPTARIARDVAAECPLRRVCNVCQMAAEAPR